MKILILAFGISFLAWSQATVNGVPNQNVSGVSATPASPTNSVQFNNAGSFGGNSNFLWDNIAIQSVIGGTTGVFPLAQIANLTGGIGGTTSISRIGTLDDGGGSALTLEGDGTGNNPSIIGFGSNGSMSSPTASGNDDTIFDLVFAGHDGTTFQQSAYINSNVVGTPISGHVAAKINLSAVDLSGTEHKVTVSPNGTFTLSNLTCVGCTLPGTTSAIGGSALLPGACAAGTATVTGATSAMVASASPSSDPDSVLTTGISIYSFVSSANTVTVRICAIVAVTPASTTYNVRVTP